MKIMTKKNSFQAFHTNPTDQMDNFNVIINKTIDKQMKTKKIK